MATLDSLAYAREKGLRPDANRIALKAVRSILDAAEPLELSVEGTRIQVIEALRLPSTPWPAEGILGLEELVDGPWPQPAVLHCSWDGGASELVISARRAGQTYRDLVSLLIETQRVPQQLVWINVAAWLRTDSDPEVPLYGWFALSKHIADEAAQVRQQKERANALRQIVGRSGLPIDSKSSIEAFTVRLSDGAVLPSPRDAFRRVVHLALLKMPFIVKNLSEAIVGRPPFGPDEATHRSHSVLTQTESSIYPSIAEEDLEPAIVDEEETSALEEVAEGSVLAEGDVPPRWTHEIEILPDLVRQSLGRLELPDQLILQVTTALSSGKHILLVGPPGTGKTELANALAKVAQLAGYCNGAHCATASADWTTSETIGGYVIQKDGSLQFRPGAFLRALDGHRWLLIDELNRADVDRAFGELMTVLAGQRADTSFTLPNGRTVSIGTAEGETHRVARAFRVIATMNTWDKTSLFRLSYAVQRRFAIVHVGLPSDDAYARLIERHASSEGAGPRLDDAATGRLLELFRVSGLLGYRAIGPAVAIDVVRYVRLRRAGGDGFAEAIGMYLLPQLEGLAPDLAAKVFGLLSRAITGWASKDACREMRARYEEIFPRARLPEA